MPVILNRLEQKLSIPVDGNKSILLEPKGKAKISDKDAESYGVGVARQAKKVVLINDASGSSTKSSSTTTQ